MIPPVILITAKSQSIRLPNKNMLIIGGKPMLEWSLIAAQNIPCKEVVVCTDIPYVKNINKLYGYTIIDHPKNQTHKEVIEYAIKQTNNEQYPVILLQPSSPFRYNNIINMCLEKYNKFLDHTILTNTTNHNAVISENQLINYSNSIHLWDGCVAIYPPNELCEYNKVQCVRNFPINSIQIDTEEDYILACHAYETYKPIKNVLSSSIYNLLFPIFRRNGILGSVTLVTRETGRPIPQHDPVIYVNHCLGYDGGRCDVLFLIANPHIVKVGISDNLRACAQKAKFIIIRNNGELDWLINNLPEIRGKFYPLRDAIDSFDDRLTTGCIAIDTLHQLGLKVNIIGLYDIKNIHTTLDSFHYPSISREISLIKNAGLI